MKGLVLSITAGQGHNQTAMVISKRFNECGVECKYLDVYKFINPILSDSVNKNVRKTRSTVRCRHTRTE